MGSLLNLLCNLATQMKGILLHIEEFKQGVSALFHSLYPVARETHNSLVFIPVRRHERRRP